MPTPELIRALFSQSSATGGRSSALQPLGWLTTILIAGLVLIEMWEAPDWIIITLVVLLISTVVMYLLIYLYYAIKNPDALRSEKFTLSKMAIEKNLIGDDRSGLLELPEFDERPGGRALPDVRQQGESS
ncbi:MAG: hypothetical protein N0E54_19150 [Candidatus Thiodiazotropha taylori]|nr:hypothetical protein [Candidatus Thiodiazotropha endolucinida]MCW4230866.1 hypothetical protein [Candidatus Thiodiazotropha taylori]